MSGLLSSVDFITKAIEPQLRLANEEKMLDAQAEMIAREMADVRRDTLSLFDLAREEDLHQSPGGGFRPVIWHLAHIGVFEAYWLLQKLRGENSPDERYERIFDPIKTPREESKNLPSRAEMERYLARVRESAMRSLEEAEFDESDPLLRDLYVFHLVLEHERQHQETITFLLHLLDPAKKTRPPQTFEKDSSSPQNTATLSNDMIYVPAGPFTFGSDGRSFAYDNEIPAHERFIPAFRIDRLLTTNEEYARFVNEGGYARREFWSDDGWAWRERENWTAPFYWSHRGDGWHARRMFDAGLIEPDHPVTGVSWYEAEAYARFMNKRLPTEAEWEKAASWDASKEQKRRFAWGDEAPTVSRCNFSNNFWGTTAAGTFLEGASPCGCLDMTGNLWEWTADPFAGFPGFKAFPYPEYSETWFDGDHRVLKGGSWATGASVLRISFRNFFRRHFRIAPAGIRCAADA